MNPIIVLVLAQILFSAGDLLARHNMAKHDFALETFLSFWFVLYFCLRTLAMFGQLYAFTQIEVGKTMALVGATSIILSNVFGLLLLKEVLSPASYAGVALAILAFIILAVKV